MFEHTDLVDLALQIPDAWRSKIVGNVAGANFKVLRMDGHAYPNESHTFNEILLVLEGQMNLQIGGNLVVVRSGEACMVPAGLPHAVAEGGQGTLVIIDHNG